jgi:hydrogenase maturation protein HypF
VMLRQILHDLHNKISPRIISARFHNALVQWAVDVVKRSSNTKIVLGGGCFQNRLLTERIAKELRRIGRQVFTPGVIPPGDGGLAAGQLAVALSRLTPVK